MSAPQTDSRPGLHYLPGFVTPGEQAQLVKAIDAAPWNGSLATRRTQHHGYLYDYRARTIEPRHYLGPLPEWLQPVADRILSQTGLFLKTPVQCIINEYRPKQGISWHYDALTFGPEIATISLLEPWHMEFHPKYSRSLTHGERDSRLETGSCLIMTGDSRYKWFHSIPKLTQEKDGHQRGRRISLTFRTLAQP